MNPSVISKTACDLGEGIFVSDDADTVYWLDISKSKIFAYCIQRKELILDVRLHHNPSVILEVVANQLIYADRFGVKSLDLDSHEVRPINTHLNNDPKSLRGNDGVKLRDGSYIFGTMYDDPSKGAGKLYLLTPEGKTNIFGQRQKKLASVLHKTP